MSSFGRFTQALGGVVETLSYASPTLTLTQSVGTSPLTTTISGGGGISGSGTINRIPRFVGSTSLGDSNIIDFGNAVKVYVKNAFVAGIAINDATAPDSGIEFPATQVASASANNLDDYEEGTWTMEISFGDASVGITYGNNTGNYTKVGRQVTVTGYLNMLNKGSSTGIAKITGLPFTIANFTPNYSSVSLRLYNITFAGQFQGFGAVNTNNINLENISILGTISAITDANFANTSAVIVSLTYFV